MVDYKIISEKDGEIFLEEIPDDNKGIKEPEPELKVSKFSLPFNEYLYILQKYFLVFSSSIFIPLFSKYS